MKKLLFAIIACLALCSCNTQFGLAYQVKLTGDGDGQFSVTFPQGSYTMDGTATLALSVGDTLPFNNPQVTTKAEVIERGNARQLKALQAANDSIAAQFSATEGTSTYDLWLRGFVKEIGTGLIFEVDRHFTNRPPNDATHPHAAALRKAPASDPYPYIK
ncbi:MAG: hypothetical protein IKD12_00920 [Paludibacteraceae bacterium]|nr:hypothetical protein [Paludibacteraceae bacterium]